MTFKDLVAVETFALGAIGVAACDIAARLPSPAGSSDAGLAWIVLLVTVVAAACLAARPRHWAAPYVLTIIWAAHAGSQLGDALYSWSDIPARVSAAEAAIVATAILKLAARSTTVCDFAGVALRGAASIMLLLFAYVHLSQAQAIANLIPTSMPLRPVLPLISGAVMAMGGILLWAPRLLWPVCSLIAAMFLAWIPLIHVPRLANDPASGSEWRFAFMALWLSGCLLIAGNKKLEGLRPSLDWNRPNREPS